MAARQAGHEHLRGMQAETQALVTPLVAEAAGTAKRSTRTETALGDLHEGHAEHRTSLVEIAECEGRPQPGQADQPVTNYKINLTKRVVCMFSHPAGI
jgi:hypothetical protein